MACPVYIVECLIPAYEKGFKKMLSEALDSMEVLTDVSRGVEDHFWQKDEKDCVVIFHNMTHARLNARVNAYFKKHNACFEERKHFLQLKESLHKKEQIDWTSPVERYLFDDLVGRELCTFLSVEEGNAVLLTPYFSY
jgi:hypothetical protein